MLQLGTIIITREISLQGGLWMCLVKRLFIAALTISDIPKSRVPQLTCIWMSLPGASGLGNLTKTLLKALRTQGLTALTSNFGLVGLVQYAW